MLKFRSSNYEDKEYDNCGNTTKAVLEIDNITIPLCAECVDDLNKQLTEYNNTVFCYKCTEFIMSRSGWRYGGSCKKKAMEHGMAITEDDAGFCYCVDCMDTCRYANLREV